MSDESFGRQPLPVSIAINGHPIDVEYWMQEISRRVTFKGDLVQKLTTNEFKIYPRAVND